MKSPWLMFVVGALAGCGAQSFLPITDDDGDVERPLDITSGCSSPSLSAPEVVGSINLLEDWQPGLEGNPDHFQLDVAGGLACIDRGLDGFVLLDVSDPRSPTVVGGVATQNPSWGGVAIVGDLLVTLGEGTGFAAERFVLSLFDIADRGSPVLRGSVALPLPPRVVETLDGDTVIVGLGGTSDAGVRLVDLRRAAAPTILAGVDQAPAYAIAVAGETAVTVGPLLNAYDVSDGALTPLVTGSTEEFRDLAVSSTLLFTSSVPSSLGGLGMIRLADGVGGLHENLSAEGFEHAELDVTGMVVVAGEGTTVGSFDLDDAGDGEVQPLVLELPVREGARIERVKARGAYAYVLTSDLRLTIVDLRCDVR